MPTREAAVFLIEASGLKRIAIEEARRLLGEPTPVAIAYRNDRGLPPPPSRELWRMMGAPAPDGDAVARTFARVLRPGTLVFILSGRPSGPQP
jgi:hypothetical protein